MTPEPTPQATRFAGWKQIGDYLGKSARTVQRWEKELDFPIQRIRTPKGQIIYADRQEIDRWLARQSAGALTDGESIDAAFQPTDGPTASSFGSPSSSPLRWFSKVGLISACGIVVLAVIASVVRDRLSTNPESQPTLTSVPAAGAAVSLTRAAADEVYATLRGAIVVVDATEGRVIRTIAVPRDASFTSLGPAALSFDERTLVFPTEGMDGVAIFDLATEHFARWYEVPDRRLTRASLSLDGKRIHAVDKVGRLQILDVETGVQIDVVPVAGGESFDGMLNRRGDVFYLLSRDAGTVSMINMVTRSVVQTIVTAIGAHDIVMTSNGSRAFVTNEYAGSMSCLDAEENRVIKTVAVGRNPARLALDYSGRAVYVSNRDSNSISVVNPVTCEVLRTILGAVPGSTVGAVGTNRDGNRLFVAASDRPLLVEFDAVSWRPIATIPLRFEALSIVPSPIGLASKAGTRAAH